MAITQKADQRPSGREGIQLAVEILRQRFADRLSTAQAVREQHGHTTTFLENQAPDAVVFAHSTEEVAEIVRVCAEHKVPVIAFGAGTSLEGHLNAPQGGISIDLSNMNRVVAVHGEDLDCTVEAGITRKALNAYLRDTGLFFPIDPGADASLGGMASTRASGTNAVRYGTMRDNVISVKAVMADGRIVETARRTRKSSAGYDLTRLLVGAEGTLGIITELTLRLHGIPEAISAGSCSFPSEEAACQAVIETMQMGIPVARIELLDTLQVKAVNSYSKLSLPEEPLLLLEFHGSDAGVKEQAETFKAIAEDNGGGPFVWTTDHEERNRLWQARHDAYWAVLALEPGKKAIATDVCVPISRLAECVAETQRDIEKAGLTAPIVGHVGDGNFHVSILLNEDDEEEIERVEAFISSLNMRALAMEGTCTGEHGIGQRKQKYLVHELGAGVDYMRAIKQALDPDNIMNPGKILGPR
ncbi:MAG: FAD-linked oxidase C-terminal domain-containing protein [Pseudomonadota bacterium]